MDSAACRERYVTFMPFAVLEGMEKEARQGAFAGYPGADAG